MPEFAKLAQLISRDQFPIVPPDPARNKGVLHETCTSADGTNFYATLLSNGTLYLWATKDGKPFGSVQVTRLKQTSGNWLALFK